MGPLPSDAAIFSPSVARQAASAAKDWSYVDGWLASKYKGRAPPPFERNPETLKALLALAGLNETADENRHLLASAEAEALQEIRSYEQGARDEDGVSAFREEFLAALEDSLTKEGKASLDAMAAAALRLCISFPEPAQLGQAMLDLQTRYFDLAQSVARVDTLQRHIDAESARLDKLLDEVNGDEYRSPADLARQNLEMQRKVKAVAMKLPEMKDKVSSLARAAGVPNPTIEQLQHDEGRYLELVEVKRSLEQQVNEFEGLPPDTDEARRQLDMLRRELRNLTDRRDAVFENLVERETPRKGR